MGETIPTLKYDRSFERRVNDMSSLEIKRAESFNNPYQEEDHHDLLLCFLRVFLTA